MSVETSAGHADASGVVSAVAGRTLPAPGRWQIDPAHSTVGFAVRHATVTTVRGRFTDFSGVIDVTADPTSSFVEVSIQTGSFFTAMPVRDDDVRGPDWLDAAQFPMLRYRSTGVDLNGATGTLHGELTIRGITRPVDLDVEYVGVADTPTGERRAGFAATTRIDRRDFGVARNVPLATGGFFVSYAVEITLDISAVAAAPA